MTYTYGMQNEIVERRGSKYDCGWNGQVLLCGVTYRLIENVGRRGASRTWVRLDSMRKDTAYRRVTHCEVTVVRASKTSPWKAGDRTSVHSYLLAL